MPVSGNYNVMENCLSTLKSPNDLPAWMCRWIIRYWWRNTRFHAIHRYICKWSFYFQEKSLNNRCHETFILICMVIFLLMSWQRQLLFLIVFPWNVPYIDNERACTGRPRSLGISEYAFSRAVAIHFYYYRKQTTLF